MLLMNYNIYSIDLPDEKDLSKEQINLLENYKLIYSELEKTPQVQDRKIIDSTIKILTQFYHIFNATLKDKYRYWYRFQITLVDPLIGPCAKLSELITACNLQEKVAVTQDGKSVLVPIDQKDFASVKFLGLLNKDMPKLKYRKIKI